MREHNETVTWWILLALITLVIVVLGVHAVNGQECTTCGPGGWGPSPAAVAAPIPQQRPVVSVERPPAWAARIAVPERGGTGYGSGALVQVDSQFGYVVTNFHVIRQAVGAPVVQFPAGSAGPATIIRQDKVSDLALLRVTRPGAITPVALGQRIPYQGDLIRIGGYGIGSFRSVRGRVIQFLSSTGSPEGDLIEVDAPSRQGDSGGPMLDEQGRLVGVLFGTACGKTAGAHLGRIRTLLSCIRQQAPAVVQQAPISSPDVLAELASLKAVVLAMQLEAGPPGEQGPQGPPGADGATPDLSAILARLDALEATLANLPPLYIRTFNPDGTIHQEATAHLGDTVRLPPLRIQTLNPDGTIHQDASANLGDTVRLKPFYLKSQSKAE